jgi:hypothetical protein
MEASIEKQVRDRKEKGKKMEERQKIVEERVTEKDLEDTVRMCDGMEKDSNEWSKKSKGSTRRLKNQRKGSQKIKRRKKRRVRNPRTESRRWRMFTIKDREERQE